MALTEKAAPLRRDAVRWWAAQPAFDGVATAQLSVIGYDGWRRKGAARYVMNRGMLSPRFAINVAEVFGL
jgi:hypothetical protein